jgi:hypothetical protein
LKTGIVEKIRTIFINNSLMRLPRPLAVDLLTFRATTTAATPQASSTVP